MKRLNPETGKPYKRGDIREDGMLFHGYKTNKIKLDGFFVENWCTADAMAKHIAAVKRNQKVWYQKNSEKRKEKSKKWSEENKIKVRAFKAKWKKNNRDVENFHKAKRRAAKLQRTPKWLTVKHRQEIKAIYATARQLEQQYGEKMHVDHIVPLVNKRVSGLHVPWNLQILTEEQNTKKSNKFDI